jgi:hypothetical protein
MPEEDPSECSAITGALNVNKTYCSQRLSRSEGLSREHIEIVGIVII